MARSKRTEPDDSDALPALRVPPDEATTQLRRQVERGEALRTAAGPRSEPELETFRSGYYTWLEYTDTLLKRLFTTPQLAEEFSWTPGITVLGHRESVQEQYQRDLEGIQSRLRKLNSIIERLPLFELAPGVTPSAPAPAGLSGSRTNVFVVHGHDDRRTSEVARFLERIGLRAVILREQPDQGQTIIEKFANHADVGFAVVLLTPDDEGRARNGSDLLPRARQNVVLELGYFLGRLGRKYVSALRAPGVELPSDLGGVLYIELDEAGAWQLRLARELRAAGAQVDASKIL